MLGGISGAELLDATEPVMRGTTGWRGRDNARSLVFRRIADVHRVIEEADPAYAAWLAECAEIDKANVKLSFKNWLQVGMIFETEDGRRFLVGHCMTNGVVSYYGDPEWHLVDGETRIVRYCMLELPFTLAED
jgi:hypothetical protein